MNAIDNGDNVGSRLPLDVDDDGRLAVHPRGLLRVFGGIDNRGNIGSANGCSISIGDDDRLVI